MLIFVRENEVLKMKVFLKKKHTKWMKQQRPAIPGMTFASTMPSERSITYGKLCPAADQ